MGGSARCHGVGRCTQLVGKAPLQPLAQERGAAAALLKPSGAAVHTASHNHVSSTREDVLPRVS